MGSIRDRAEIAEIREYLLSHPELLKESKTMKFLDKNWFIPVVGLLITLGVLYGNFQRHEKDISETKCTVDGLKTDVTELKIIIPEIRDSLKEIKREVREQNERSR